MLGTKLACTSLQQNTFNMFNVETHVCSGHVFSTLPERNMPLPAPSDPQMCDVCCKVCSVNTQLGAGCGVNYLSLGGLRLTQDQILVSNILSVSGTMIMRIKKAPPKAPPTKRSDLEIFFYRFTFFYRFIACRASNSNSKCHDTIKRAMRGLKSMRARELQCGGGLGGPV